MRALPFLSLCLLVACGGNETSTTNGTTTGGGTGTSTVIGGGGATTTTATTGGGGATPTTGGGGATPTTGGASPTGGTAGAPTTGGTGGATTTTTTTTTSGMPGPCTWGDDCGAGYYCFAPGCAAGTCIQTPAPAGLPPDPDPVCGCDGVTYWNEPVAASKGMSVALAGACAMSIPCGPGMQCPGAMKCNRQVPDQPSCDPQVTGECWGTPLSCALDGPLGRACTNDKCELRCSLIQSQNAWFEDPTCN